MHTTSTLRGGSLAYLLTQTLPMHNLQRGGEVMDAHRLVCVRACVCVPAFSVLTHLSDARTSTEGPCYLGRNLRSVNEMRVTPCVQRSSLRVKQAGRTRASLLIELRLLLWLLLLLLMLHGRGPRGAKESARGFVLSPHLPDLHSSPVLSPSLVSRALSIQARSARATHRRQREERRR